MKQTVCFTFSRIYLKVTYDHKLLFSRHAPFATSTKKTKHSLLHTCFRLRIDIFISLPRRQAHVSCSQTITSHQFRFRALLPTLYQMSNIEPCKIIHNAARYDKPGKARGQTIEGGRFFFLPGKRILLDFLPRK